MSCRMAACKRLIRPTMLIRRPDKRSAIRHNSGCFLPAIRSAALHTPSTILPRSSARRWSARISAWRNDPVRFFRPSPRTSHVAGSSESPAPSSADDASGIEAPFSCRLPMRFSFRHNVIRAFSLVQLPWPPDPDALETKGIARQYHLLTGAGVS